MNYDFINMIILNSQRRWEGLSAAFKNVNGADPSLQNPDDLSVESAFEDC